MLELDISKIYECNIIGRKMGNKFELLESFKNKDFVIDLPLCTVLMEDKEFPWLLLIPRKPNVKQMNYLSLEDRIQLMQEITLTSNIMEKLFPTDILNVAAIGNKTPQLHVHVISRNKHDSLWPEVVWGKDMKKLTEEERNERVKIIKEEFQRQV